MALLQLVLALASPVVAAVASWAIPMEAQVLEEALADSQELGFPELPWEQARTKTPEQEAALRCRMVY